MKTGKAARAAASSSPANIGTTLPELLASSQDTKMTRAWQAALWALWPAEAQWPGVLDLYEAAAFRRVHPDTIRRLCLPDRHGQAQLQHQRLGASYRIRKASLERVGLVKERSAA
jgi:hypothetical protein